jgi:tetratricopeptide (TPR) repeat protein
VLACAVHVLVAAPAAKVRVWRGTIELPTYAEDAPNPNPPFDLFAFGRFNYPYAIRDALTDRREIVSWRSLNLENEYLRVTVLPDIGGHLYRCLDKRTGREMFYANSAIKKALIGYRGAWAAFGIEFNFPVSHNWMSMSPVDFATTENADGSGSIWVGNKDQVYGAQWRVQLSLQPGRAVLEQQTTLYNPSDVRHRYYWWNNAAVQVWEDSRLAYPTELMATHGFTAVEPWPIDRQGRDLSVIRNQTDGPVSLFTYLTREGFVGVYHPHTQSGTVHIASPAELPVHKFWSWGYDRDAASWRTALSDDDSGYVELQSGLFRNQETYAFLEPQETVRFSEHWLPVRDLGGITRATVDAVLHMDRPSPNKLRLALDVTRDLPSATISLRQGKKMLGVRKVNLSPRDVSRDELDGLEAGPVTFELLDAQGQSVLRHTENVFDRTPASAVAIGPRRGESPSTETADGLLESATLDELEGRRLVAMGKYRDGLGRFPKSLPLLKAAGRLAVVLGWADANGTASRRSIDWLEAAAARNTTDFETQYYLGLALMNAGNAAEARSHLEAAQRFRATHSAASLQLARLSAQQGDWTSALEQLRMATADAPFASLSGALEVTALRHLHRADEAGTRARHWQEIDPTNSLLRYERTLLGDSDQTLWVHLGTDANRVLDIVDQYFAMGAYEDALGLMTHEYPSIDASLREPGAVLPVESPLVAYYRGYARDRTGGTPAADYAAAAKRSTQYVFPHRRTSYAVLEDALRANPQDATARFLAGSLYLSSGLTDSAIDAWQQARRIGPSIPTLHRNLGLALLYASGNYTEARAVLEEGLTADSTNVEVYLTLDGVLSAANASPAARVAALRRYPPDRMPSALVFKLALALSESGDATAAEQLFHGRFFPREEGGTNVRSVYTQTRLISASLAAQSGGCSQALAILDALPREQKDLAFTAGGMADTLEPAAVALQVAAIDSTCGREAEARTQWTRVDRVLTTGGSPIALGAGAEARRRLGRPLSAEERRRIEEALESVTRTLDSAGGSNPGFLEYIRALLLTALGRKDEALGSIGRVFVYPDRNMSHALARRANITK